MTGMKWNLRFGLDEYGQLSASDSARQFVDHPQSPHRMVLLYQTGAVDRNQLLYAVAAYNFAHFEVKSFDLSMEETGSFSMLIIRGFNSLEETLGYYAMIYAPEGYASAIDRAVSFFPFSDENYETLLHGKTLEEYMTFFAEKYGAQAPELVARWRMQVAADAEETSREDIAVEQAADVDTETPEEKELPQKKTKEEISEEALLPQQKTVQEAQEPFIQKEQEQPAEEATEEVEPEEKNIHEVEEQAVSAEEQQTVSSDTTATSQDSVLVKPKEITLEYLQKRRAQSEKKERLEQEEKEKSLEEKRKEAAKQKKQLLKERETLRRQKAKEAKERLKRKEKERKEKEKANRQRQKEKEAARSAAQKEKAAARKAQTRK